MLTERCLNIDALLPESLLFKKELTTAPLARQLLLLGPAFSLLRKLDEGLAPQLAAAAAPEGKKDVTVRDLTMFAEPAPLPLVPEVVEVAARPWAAEDDDEEDCRMGVAVTCLDLPGVAGLLITLLKGFAAGLATSAVGARMGLKGTTAGVARCGARAVSMAVVMRALTALSCRYYVQFP